MVDTSTPSAKRIEVNLSAVLDGPSGAKSQVGAFRTTGTAFLRDTDKLIVLLSSGERLQSCEPTSATQR